MSYSSLLHHSVSARREALYRAKGLDIDRWMDLVSEAKGLRREISKIGEDYDEHRGKDGDTEEGESRERGVEDQQDDLEREDDTRAVEPDPVDELDYRERIRS